MTYKYRLVVKCGAVFWRNDPCGRFHLGMYTNIAHYLNEGIEDVASSQLLDRQLNYQQKLYEFYGTATKEEILNSLLKMNC